MFKHIEIIPFGKHFNLNLQGEFRGIFNRNTFKFVCIYIRRHTYVYVTKLEQFYRKIKIITMVAFPRRRRYDLLTRTLINIETGILFMHLGSLLEFTINRLQRRRDPKYTISHLTVMYQCTFLSLPLKCAIMPVQLTGHCSHRQCAVNFLILLLLLYFWMTCGDIKPFTF